MQKVEGSSPFSRFHAVPVSKPLEPCAQAGHPGRLGLLYGDQQLVGEAVRVKSRRAPATLTAFAGAQLPDGLSGEGAWARPDARSRAVSMRAGARSAVRRVPEDHVLHEILIPRRRICTPA
jgi:hypothetical protein